MTTPRHGTRHVSATDAHDPATGRVVAILSSLDTMTAGLFRSLAHPRSFTVVQDTFYVGPPEVFIGFDEGMTPDEVSSMCALLTDLTNAWLFKGTAPKLSAEGR